MKLKIKPIRKSNIADEVFEQLKVNIIENVWEAGSKLPSENELASMFDVSRISVRAAINKLDGLGLVETRRGEGTFVKEITPSLYFNFLIPRLVLKPRDHIEVIELRRGIEKETVKLAAQRATEEDIRKLETIFKKMKEYKDQNDLDAYATEDFNFHIQVAKASKNSILVDVMMVLKDILFIHYEKMVKDVGVDTGFEFHGKIIEALRKKDADIAGDYLEQMLGVIVKMIDEKL